MAVVGGFAKKLTGGLGFVVDVVTVAAGRFVLLQPVTPIAPAASAAVTRRTVQIRRRRIGEMLRGADVTIPAAARAPAVVPSARS
ncbi:MAG TPA: hypothetical protein VFW74_00580 [Acidimicrobiia bacterium]|nr:hypothetical protein [Acidimicrobiia bacterium]